MCTKIRCNGLVQMPFNPFLNPSCPQLFNGDYESDNLNKLYGFEGEVKSKYNSQMMELFSEVFNWLPLAHCIQGKILVGTRARARYWWVLGLGQGTGGY